ncbi:MAG TPA: hypothetical protein VL128_00555 [Candidatus Eisenbacteria bacterium]|nr:hypothetical protein [Candidatus Eisenbacteria bacterium]
MKLLFLLLWLAGGGSVALAIGLCVNLLWLCQSRLDAEDEAVWNLLVPKDRG